MYSEKTQKLKREKGITLIALVITIVVLIILASVAINMAFGDSGLIKITEEAKEKSEEAQIKESISLAWSECETDYQVMAEENKTRSQVYTEDNLKSKISQGNISDFIYNEDGKSSMVYYANDGMKYNIEIIGNKVSIKEDTTTIDDKKDWKNCTECSEGNPHIITNKYEFDSIRTHINTDENGTEYIGGYFKLANDIYFYDSDFEEGGDFYNNGNGFMPIGLKEGVYDNIWQSGLLVYSVRMNFNGDDKEIRNIKINTEEGQRDYNAPFARLDEGGKIENLVISNLQVTAPTSVAGIVRAIYKGAEIKNITLKNSICKTTKGIGAMKSSGLLAGYIEGKASKIGIYNCEFKSNSWYGAGISGQINNNSEIDGVIVEECNIETYVEGGMIAGSVTEGTRIKNISVKNTEYVYTHTDIERAGLLFYNQKEVNESNPVIFENLIMDNVKYNNKLGKLIGVGYGKLINSNINLNCDDNKELIKDNVIFENSNITY